MTLDEFIRRVKLEQINITVLFEGSQQAESKHQADTVANGEVEKEIYRRLRRSDDPALKDLPLIYVPILTNNIAYLKSIAPQWKGVKATLRLDNISLSPIQLALHCNNMAAIAVLASMCGAHSLGQFLFEAVKHSKTDSALALIAAGADVNLKCGDWAPLMKASYKGDFAVVSAIIKSGRADLDLQRSNSDTALYLAIQRGKNECALALIEAGADINLRCINWTPLMKAAYEGNLAVMKAIIARDEAVLNAQTSSGDTALYMAIQRGKNECALALIEAGADINLRCNDWTPLMKAAYEGNLAVMKTIIAQDGAELNAQRRNGATALYLAIERGKNECALALIAAGADINLRCNDWTPLMKASYKGDFAVVSAIIKSGRADLDLQRSNGATALYLAIERGKTECALALIEAGADVNHKFGDLSPLMQAAHDGNHAVVAAIIKSGRVNLDLRSNRCTGREAYALARQGEHKDCAMLIVRALMLHNKRYARHWPRNIQDIYIEWFGQYDRPIKAVDMAEKAIKAIAAIEDEATKCFLANQILHCKGSPLYVIAHSKSLNGLINSAIARLFKQQQSGPLSEVKSIFDESRKRLEASGNYLPYSMPCDSQVGDDGDESKHDDSVVEAAVIAQPLRQ